MAVIGKIRQRSGLLIGIIGASIVGFLVMDATNSQFSVLRGRKDSVGKVNGEKIGIQEFEKKYEENVKAQEDQMRGQGVTEDMRNYLRNMTWDQIVNDAIFTRVYNKLGLTVTPAEMSELATGENVHPYIKQNFSNPQTGQFDPNVVRNYLQNLDKDAPNTEPGSNRKQWMRFEESMMKDQYQKKYDNLITKALMVPTWQAEMAYTDASRTVDFKFVQVPYTDVADADVKVTDEDLQKYMNEHAAAFKSDVETRKIEFVTFDIAASSGDSAAIVKQLEEKREEFAKGTTVSDDSLFVKIYSETPFDDVYYTADKMTSPVKDSFFTLPVKTIVGPYVDGNEFKLAKISDRKMVSDSVRVREISISFAGVTTQEQAQAKYMLADSIVKQIDSLHGDFAAFAATFSDDAISKVKGGDIGWVKQGEKEPEYNNILFYRGKKGQTYRAASQQQNAIHLFQIVEEKPSKVGVLVTYLSREIIPSPETEKNIYGIASGFAADNQNEAKFKEAAKKLNVKTVGDLHEDMFNINGLGTSRELVKWAFKANKGDVSSIFTVGGDKHVVALLDEVTPKGLKPLDAVREQVKALVVREKKYELLAKKIEDANASTIDALAGKLSKQVSEVDNSSFASPNMNGYYEPNVVAAALNSPVGKVSKPIKGSNGVYAVQTLAVHEPAKATDLSQYAMSLKPRLEGKAKNASDVQKKLSDVEDNRSVFF